MIATFSLDHFLPYLLNQAAERTGKRFESLYRDGHGLSRTQWRIVAHLARDGSMTAAAVSRRSNTEKTKVSRAVAALETDGLLVRSQATDDRRTESLSLTPAGQALFEIIAAQAQAFDAALRERLGPERATQLEQALRILAEPASDAD